MNSKYIRTKDGIEKVTNDYANKLIETHNLKIADTIEELCDEIVIKAYIDSKPQIYHSVSIEDLVRFKEKDTIVYGAIWTDRGLIYVAILNNKGGLKLL